MGDKKRILIVEDEAVTTILLKRVLVRQGYEICGIVSTGREAIDKCFSLNPDLIIMDVYLAGAIDGIEAARIIRQKFSVPIIYTTGAVQDVLAERLSEHEAATVLYKPYKMEELVARVGDALNG